MALQRAPPDQHNHGQTTGAAMDFSERDAGEGRRYSARLRSNDVCDRTYEPRLWAGPGYWTPDVALLQAAAAGSEHLLRAGESRLCRARKQAFQGQPRIQIGGAG